MLATVMHPCGEATAFFCLVHSLGVELIPANDGEPDVVVPMEDMEQNRLSQRKYLLEKLGITEPRPPTPHEKAQAEAARNVLESLQTQVIRGVALSEARKAGESDMMQFAEAFRGAEAQAKQAIQDYLDIVAEQVRTARTV